MTAQAQIFAQFHQAFVIPNFGILRDRPGLEMLPNLLKISLGVDLPVGLVKKAKRLARDDAV